MEPGGVTASSSEAVLPRGVRIAVPVLRPLGHTHVHDMWVPELVGPNVILVFLFRVCWIGSVVCY